ncbi:MAG: 4Fe-4S dicluster domain-containing protein [Chloroflexi bacterium]|nr:4Fe-4S dicluster domain-containing protein [Chloroflexota bacterium]
MNVSRRKFLGMAAKVMVGGIIVYGVTPSVLEAIARDKTPQASSPNDGKQKHQWVFVVDVSKCIGCMKCLEACKRENLVPPDPDSRRTWVEEYTAGEDGAALGHTANWGSDGPERTGPSAEHQEPAGTKGFFVPKLCNQCEDPPCVPVCPVSATFQTEDGIVLVDAKRCIGCKYCIMACPYGARYLHNGTRTVDKCTWCYHRITKGLPPACVEVCPVEARLFGDLNDPESPVRKLLKEKMTQVLRPETGTKPRVRYLGLQEGVR